MPYADPVDHAQATAFTAGAIGRAHALAAASDGAVAVVTDVAALDRCHADGTLAMVLHLEGAEAIDPGLSALDAWHAAGVRSLGLVWSRPNAFGHGVPFRFPASPDTGPGLTDAGRALVRRCAELGILVDVSHLNAAGFADVARLAAAPLVASHTACHALCASTRNLTDDQLREIGAQRRHRGDRLRAAFVRADGADDADTPLSDPRGPRPPRRGARRHRSRGPGLGLRRRADARGDQRRRRPAAPARRAARRRLQRRRGASASPGATGGACSPLCLGRLTASAPSACAPTRAARGRTPPSRSAGAASGPLPPPPTAAAAVVAAAVVARAAHEPRGHARGLDPGDDQQRAGRSAPLATTAAPPA